MPSSEYQMSQSDRKIYRIAYVTVFALAVCAAILSYSALKQLAVDSGINQYLSYLFPLIIDGLILSGSLLILFSANRGRRSWGGFALTALGVVASIAGNVAVSPKDITAQLVHAAAPIVLFLALEATTSLVRSLQRERQERDRVNSGRVSQTVPVPVFTSVDTGRASQDAHVEEVGAPSAQSAIEGAPAPQTAITVPVEPALTTEGSRAVTPKGEPEAPPEVEPKAKPYTQPATPREASAAPKPKQGAGEGPTVSQLVREAVAAHPNEDVSIIADMIPHDNRPYVRRLIRKELDK